MWNTWPKQRMFLTLMGISNNTVVQSILDFVIMLAKTRMTETNIWNSKHSRIACKCTSSQIWTLPAPYYSGVCPDQQRNCNTIIRQPTALLRQSCNGYVLIYMKRSLRHEPEQICIRGEEWHSTGTTMLKKYSADQSLYYSQCGFVDNPPLASGLKTSKGMTTHTLNKLQPRKAGLL